jgi:hypothetical protein
MKAVSDTAAHRHLVHTLLTSNMPRKKASQLKGQ